MLTVEVRNVKFVSKSLQDLGRDVPRIGREQMFRMCQTIVRRSKEYPPKPTRSTYRRTYNFRNAWKITPGSMSYTIRNAVEKNGKYYGRYVMGDADSKGQAWMHIGRWTLVRKIADEEMAKLPKEVSDLLQISAQQKGLAP